jgi:tetratricopeptide (TPR) repeat protein
MAAIDAMSIPAKRNEPVVKRFARSVPGRRRRQRGRSSRIPAFGLGFGIATILLTPTLHAAPFIPARDDIVLERLPDPAIGSADRTLDRRDPSEPGATDSPDAAATRAWQWIERARIEGDSRWLGRAQVELMPWWSDSAAPTAILLARATIRQREHAFEQARSDLSRLLADEPEDAQAWLTRAVIEMVQGDVAAAQKSCAALLGLGNRLSAYSCLARVGSLTGRAKQSLDLLARIVEAEELESVRQDATREARIAERLFALETLAETADRLGRGDEADRWFERAFQLAPNDSRLLAARADSLLDSGRDREVLPLLSNRTADDGLLLRLALAEQDLGLPAAAVHARELRDRFEAARRRGDRLHLGEESRHALRLEEDPEAALRLARENWAFQREPRDARTFLEAALAAGRPNAAEPVLLHLRTTKLEDSRLEALATRLKAAP